MTKDISEMMEKIVSGRSHDAEIEDFLSGLREKGETAEEIAAAAQVMRRHCVKLSRGFPEAVDTCGTGGDGKSTLNISTLAAITAAAAGAMVAKHGNRSVSSQCGSADLLELLGVSIDLPVPVIEKCLEKTGFGFFFAPKFHPATRFAMPARKKIKGKTIFNILGPLSNPAGAGAQLLGVYEARLVPIVAEVLVRLGARRALVAHGKDGLDEISLTDETLVCEVRDGAVFPSLLRPEDYGLKRASLSELTCDSPEAARADALFILKGGRGVKTDIVALNAGAVLYLAGKARGIADGLTLAKQTLESGKPYAKLEEIASFS